MSTQKQYTIWNRFKRNYPAMVSLVYILLCAVAALFAYVLAPDNSTYGNAQTIEIQARPPGYTQQFLVFPTPETSSTNAFTVFVQGNAALPRQIPITTHRFQGDSVLVHRFVDNGISIAESYKLPAETDTSALIQTKTFWLGTDNLGRDMLSRLLIGTRISFAVGIIAVIVSLIIGTILGALAGYYRKRTDAIISWLIHVSWSIPTLLLVFALTFLVGKGLWQIFIAVGLTMWVSVARLVRGQVMALREREFVQAAVAIGASDIRILLKHILPNIRGPLLVLTAGNFATAIMLEAGLSFLGIGVQPPQPSWGLMMRENYTYLLTSQPILAIIPGMAIMLLVLAFYLTGNGLRDATDVHPQD